uniref:Uncharacterized protein n=1 Tax=Streptomyces sp. NBC_01393 TaxID=2903851 RepID=A0AAU3I6P8_9ACTN
MAVEKTAGEQALERTNRELIRLLEQGRPQEPAVSPQRAQFNSALDVLLVRANLDGAEWAIRHLRVASEAAGRVAAAGKVGEPGNLDAKITEQALALAAVELEKALDKRTVELVTREN